MFYGKKQRKYLGIISAIVGVLVIVSMILLYLPAFWQ
jgi:hypothetical protein